MYAKIISKEIKSTCEDSSEDSLWQLARNRLELSMTTMLSLYNVVLMRKKIAAQSKTLKCIIILWKPSQPRELPKFCPLVQLGVRILLRSTG